MPVPFRTSAYQVPVTWHEGLRTGTRCNLPPPRLRPPPSGHRPPGAVGFRARGSRSAAAHRRCGGMYAVPGGRLGREAAGRTGKAAALAVSPPEERALLYYRKGYCAFAGATATWDPRQFLAAVTEFDKAIEAWPERTRKSAKHAAPPPVPAALRVFAAIVRLHAASGAVADGARQEIAAALELPSCNSYLMPAAFCAQLLSAGSQWLGWFALLGSQSDEAPRHFAGPPDSGWSAWAQGRHDFDNARYAAAARQYANAIDRWKQIWQGEGPTFLQALGPRPQYASALADWGGARLLAGDLPGAILTLDASLQADSASPHALFL